MGIVAELKQLSSKDANLIEQDENNVLDVAFPIDSPSSALASVDLHKLWHLLHYALCGTEEPDGSALGDAILGGQNVGPECDYGYIRIINQSRAIEIDHALREVDLQQRFNEVKQANNVPEDIYLGELLDDVSYEELESVFRSLQSFYGQAAKSSNPSISFLS